MSVAPSSLRGYQKISEVLARLTPLATWYATYRPTRHLITLTRRDLDVLHRFPEAAANEGIVIRDGHTYWRGFELKPEGAPCHTERKALP